MGKMPLMERVDVFVIGGGGTGSEIAFRLGGRGDLRVALAERDKLGGECNHYGCVPTKVMLRSAKLVHDARLAGSFGVTIPEVGVDLRAIQKRAREVVRSQSGEGSAAFERIGMRVFMQEARLVGPHRVELADGTQFQADAIVMTTGTESTAPPVDGLADGPFWTNKEAIWEPAEPPVSLVVIGSGAIGIEFAQFYARVGTRVTVLEALPWVLSNEDEDVSAVVTEALHAEGVEFRTGARVERATHVGGRWTVDLAGGDRLTAERTLVATGRRPVFEGHDLAAAGVDLDERGRPLLTETLRTTGDGVWAAGDATGELLFTHVGTYEAQLVVDDILGQPRPRDYRVVPRVTFCEPEVASVGLTEQQARDAGHEVATASQPIAENERAVIDGNTYGFVKLVADARTDELLGGHIVSDEAGAMIHEVVVAMAGRVPARAIADAIHAYPTRSESVKGAFELLSAELER
jgi:pyruvate/2-oxoglutarate dehydrogenase complex dihydrolipoamide dehydrogenase (E3) component